MKFVSYSPLNPFVDANAKYRMESESRVMKINNKSIGRKILSKLEIKKFITTNIILSPQTNFELI